MRTHVSPQPHHHRAAISLVETVIALSLTTFAASALLTAVSSSVRVSTDSLHVAIAGGLADQLLDEIAMMKFPSVTTTGSSGVGRTGFDDLDDYDGYNASPPLARDGNPVGTEGSGLLSTRPQSFQPNPRQLSRYRQRVSVEKVIESGNSWVVTTQPSNLRRVTVTISYTDAQGITTPLCTQVRIFSNVAITP